MHRQKNHHQPGWKHQNRPGRRNQNVGWRKKGNCSAELTRRCSNTHRKCNLTNIQRNGQTACWQGHCLHHFRHPNRQEWEGDWTFSDISVFSVKQQFGRTIKRILLRAKGEADTALLNANKLLVDYQRGSIRKYSTVTQCMKCGRYGYSAKSAKFENCTRPSRCVICANDHSKEECKIVLEGEVGSDLLKCKLTDTFAWLTGSWIQLDRTTKWLSAPTRTADLQTGAVGSRTVGWGDEGVARHFGTDSTKWNRSRSNFLVKVCP